MSTNHIQIFDTTLRDGEQAPGFTMNTEEKMQMAAQLARMGVDVIEAGFAAASPGDFDCVREIGHAAQGPRVVSLSRTSLGDIDASAEALKGSPNWGIHTFIATSEIHMKHKLQMDPEMVLQSAVKAVERARTYTDYVEFSCEDATRSDPDFLVKVCSDAVRAGASVLNIPDTVGYTTPDEYYALIDQLMNEVYNADQVVFSVHCHNDLGLAVANSLAAVRAGARQVECTINGIGERAGNASLEELVMALKVRSQYFNMETNIISEQIYPASRLLTQLTGMPVQVNKAIVGANAFAHEAGIHQDGVLKNPLTYEIMTPESVGIKSNNIVLGKHSGRHALADRLREMGYEIGSIELKRVFDEFKRLADLKKVVYDEDIEALVHQDPQSFKGRFILHSVNVASGTNTAPTATVEMDVDGERLKKAGFGDGPVDAAMNTIKDITGSECVLTHYKVNAITGGTDAQGEVSVTIEDDGKTVTGRGTDLDIVVASAKAFISALNRMSLKGKRIEGV